MSRLLDSSRSRIDAIDRELIRLIAERMGAVREIGGLKRGSSQTPLRDVERERALFADWAAVAQENDLSPYFVGRVLREILNYSRRYQEQFLEPARSSEEAVRIGYQGSPYSYSDLTITKLSVSRGAGAVHRLAFRTFEATVDALERGELEYALLPVENTIAGSINEVYRLLESRNVSIVDEEVWQIEHCLAGLPGTTLDRLRIIRSHTVALQQCRSFLDSLGRVQAEGVYDTAGAARSVLEEGDPEIAAICSEDAAHATGLEILRTGVADRPVNLTRFLLIALDGETVDPRMPAKTSLILTVNHRHGALASCLRTFAEHGINLTKLESRPQLTAPWEYLFYVDISGSIDQPEVAAALEEVRPYVNHLKLLGSYPDRTRETAEIPSGPSAAETEWQPTASAGEGEICVRPSSSSLSRVALPEDGARTTVRVGDVEIGGDRFVLIAGPCAVESRAQILDSAALARQAGGAILRGGAFKPRTSPYSFQGLGFPGLELLAEAGRTYELPVVTEVMRLEDAERVAEQADMLQVGARNMQNFALLKKLGTLQRPILLKRGLSATIDELLSAAEYIMANGNHRVVLCERGIRTFETSTRSTLDVSAVPVLRERTHLPVIVDPSHAAGERTLVTPLALAATAAGADGLIVEIHPRPEEALCDKEQALTGDDLEALVRRIEPIVAAQGRRF